MVAEMVLLGRARQGDENALGELVSRHHGTAFRVALSIVGDETDAADATQEGMLKALRALESFRGDASFRSWMVAIVANETRSLLRGMARRREAPLEADSPITSPGRDVADGTAMQAEAVRARALLTPLPEKQRLAVQLRVDEGLSFKDVG